MLRSIARAAFVLACVSASSQAQLGGLIKKAAQKAVEAKVEEKVEPTTPAKPLGGDPLTEATLDALLKGLSLEVETKEKTKQLWAATEAKAKEVTEADRAAGKEPDKWHTASRDVERCVEHSLDASNETHQKEAPQKMMALGTDPNRAAVMAKLTAVGKRMTDAQAKGDTPAYLKAFADYMKMLGFDPAKDSVVAFAKCGKLPAKPASMVKLERLKAELEQINEERRAAEAEGGARAAKAAGMPADTYALARERLWAWNQSRKQKASRIPVTKEEDALFAARVSDIKKLESILR